ncbi:hypothetical protein OBBRIDRAFT_487481 [Obba rivulosa]|uniref:Uncharacterized protein n=1 Tax=Obba rivulosa TaxID=1052685 RepID=A0A8E2AZC7_9APHY|nr:hypothetical protein OBBRIDRAFT_487481 [Obba rivulosa]
MNEYGRFIQGSEDGKTGYDYYGAYVRSHDDTIFIRITTGKRESYKVYGDGCAEGDVELLYKDVFREPLEEKRAEVAVRIPPQKIICLVGEGIAY